MFFFSFSGSPFRLRSLQIKECVNCMRYEKRKKTRMYFFFLYVWHNIYPLFHISRKWLLHYRYHNKRSLTIANTCISNAFTADRRKCYMFLFAFLSLALVASSRFLSRCPSSSSPCISLLPSCLIALIASLSRALSSYSCSLSSSVPISHSFRCV